MTTTLKGLLVVAAISLPGAASAQSSDADYCRLLVAKYDRYLDIRLRHGRMPASLEGREAVERCRAGDVAGIPGIEKALLDAQYSLPSRTDAGAVAPTKDPNCGIETWSTEKMTYVSLPCP